MGWSNENRGITAARADAADTHISAGNVGRYQIRAQLTKDVFAAQSIFMGLFFRGADAADDAAVAIVAPTASGWASGEALFRFEVDPALLGLPSGELEAVLGFVGPGGTGGFSFIELGSSTLVVEVT